LAQRSRRGHDPSMFRPRVLAGLAPLLLVACTRAESFGGLELDVPAGWDVMCLDQSLLVAAADVGWVWEFWLEDARTLQEHEGGVTGAGREMARDRLVDDPANEAAFELGEPAELDLGEGIVAVEMKGRAVTAGRPAGVRVVIAIAGAQAWMGLGLRDAGSAEREDARSERMVRSIRVRM
jgi:hypothetical protein